MVRKFIIDTDCGVDDAIALTVALDAHKRKEINILGVTCVNVNTKKTKKKPCFYGISYILLPRT
jgi:inosine-uridine nucleoside N-ribohydrolase